MLCAGTGEGATVSCAKAAAAETLLHAEKVDIVTKQSMFLKSMVSSDLQNVVALHHHIGIAAGTIENYVRGITNKIRSGAGGILEKEETTTTNAFGVLDESLFFSKFNTDAQAKSLQEQQSLAFGYGDLLNNIYENCTYKGYHFKKNNIKSYQTIVR